MVIPVDKRKQLLEALRTQGHVNVPGCSPVDPSKAREILHDGTVHGQPITAKQRGYFGIIASGKTPRRSA